MKTLTIDKARSARRWRERAASLAEVREAPEHVTAISNRVAVEKALSSLTAQQRIAVALRYWDDLTVPEVAAAMHLKPGTVKRYLHDAAGVLRPLLGEHIDVDDDFDEDVRVVGTKRRRR